MPQIRLEYTKNLGDIKQKALLQQVTEVLSSIADTANCKAMVYVADDYYVGSEQENAAIIHLSIGLLPGRTEEAKNEVGQRCSEVLETFFEPILKEKSLEARATVEIYDFQHYFK